jgi:uncharacterized membrane protein YccF (DUF307 family)
MGLRLVTDGQDPTELVPVVVAPAVVPAPVAAPPPLPPPPEEVARIPTIPDTRPPGEPGFLIRAVWFIFIGWWLSAAAITVAYFLCAIIIGIPLAFMIFNQLPLILTLRPRSTDFTGASPEQHPLWIRAVWFLLVGWWLGAFYLSVAWGLCVLIIPLPIGVWMFNRVGAVMTLLRY